MVYITINNTLFKAQKGLSFLQACDALEIFIPRFCFHSKLLIAGNCRICLVEVEKMPKPIASCAIAIKMAGLRVFTDTPQIRKARETVIEFLLTNHPLDCPICDQGGECDLQEQSFFFGVGSSRRFFSSKRAVSDKQLGPLVKTALTRCIQCSRCVRFFSEIVGFSFIGFSKRGSSAEIGLFNRKQTSTFFSGNVIDICPVGFFNMIQHISRLNAL